MFRSRLTTAFFVLGALCAGATAGLHSCSPAKPTTNAAQAGAASAATPATPPRVLVFSRTKGWKHTAIPHGMAAIRQLGREHNFAVDTTRDAAYFTDDSLRRYAAVVFNCTTGNVLNAAQQAAFERYIQAGGGYVGIHSAADTEYEWPWYGKLMGAYFANHPANPSDRTASVDVLDKNHPATAGLPGRWERFDEWYSYRSFYPGIKVLMHLDENTYDNGTNGADHPIAWYHEFDGGRAFYTGLGHTPESYREPLFLGHLWGGLQYAMGDNKPLDYAKAYAVPTPEENRFVKTILVNDLDTPMELAVAPDGRVFYTELRSGKVGVYNTATGETSLAHQFKVTTKGGAGLIGITVDPNFTANGFIYLYYSPPVEGEPIYFHLSRFRVKPDNTLDLASGKVLLRVPVQENSGAHHGGSLAWDKDGNLYLSTGDSSSPFPSNGYAPIDERPGKEFVSLDAQRASANTNDLKGKVLRIHPEPDGTYTVPAGNLFPKGTAGTLPEIYAMGCRNPYRIAVNPKTSTLYWGEIGPDAGQDSLRGPRGYDEFNQAKKPGFFGWPYFVGNNYAYAEWDFATRTAGPNFNPQAPVNNSPNNTGLRDLPPATPAMIWYPYAASREFPELGQGGRSAMAGEFYTYNPNASSKNKFPQYYDGALFVFDWMRNWVLALRFDQNENYLRNEPFMTANGDFRRPIDLAFGQDGTMYMLEYGSVYGADNEDARLVRIEYNTGNRPPIARASITDSAADARLNGRMFLTSDRRGRPELREIAGPAPLRVTFSSQGTRDLDDDDQVTHQWLFDGKTVGATTASAKHTYTEPGTYAAVLKVTDGSGAVGLDTLTVRVGNARPEVVVTTPGNRSFYWPGKPFPYAVRVNDAEDKKVDPRKVKVSFAYHAQPGGGATRPGSGTVAAAETASLGKTLVASSDCKACHTVDKRAVGPSFVAVAQRYKKQDGSVDLLAGKIIAGGGGNWGTEHVMSAHPQLSKADAAEMVKYIFSLTDAQKGPQTLPAEGSVALKEHTDEEPAGQYTLVASYTDNGGQGVGPLTGTDVVTLRNAKVRTVYNDGMGGFQRWGNSLGQGDHKSFVMLKNVDLTGIRRFTYEYASKDKDGEIEVRLHSQAGPVVSRTAYKATGDWKTKGQVTGELSQPLTGRHDVYFVVVKRDKPNDDIIALSTIGFEE